MSKTLTSIAMKKIAEHFLNSISHVSYLLDSNPETLQITRKVLENEIVKVYAYFDSNIIGTVSNIQLIDYDGDIVARNNNIYVKSQSKGLYVAFKYKLSETEVDIIDSI